MASGDIPKNIKASLYIDGKPAEASLKNVEQVTRTLEKELKKLTIGTDEWNKKMQQVAANKKYLSGIKQEIQGVSGAFSQLKHELGKVGTMALGFLGFQFISDQFQQMISKNAKLSDSLADVRKTTGLTEKDVLSLNGELSKLNTRTSRQELLDLASVAGKLGVTGKEDVLGFVRAADQISVALGKDLGNTEQAVNDLGKLTDLFKIKDQFGLEQSLLKTGSAINALGAAGTANEGYIVEFTKRMGTIAPAANISIENVLGLATTMDELGQPAEAASTALAQFIVGMGKDLPTFAKVAGMSVKDFSAVLRKDGNEALITVLSKLKATGGGVEELSAKMGLIGEDGARATAALGALSNNLDKLRSRQALSNDEFAKGTSLTNEFNIKNQNFGATLDKIGKYFYGLATSKVVTGTLTDIANAFAKIIGVAGTAGERASQAFEETKNSVRNLNDNLDPLMSRYDQLKSKTKLNKDEQNELKKVISQIGTLVPTAVSEFDKYGRALDINKGKLADFIKMQKALLEFQNKEAIETTASEIVETLKKREALTKALNSGKKYTSVSGGTGGASTIVRALTPEETLEMQKQLQDYSASLDNLRLRFRGLRGEQLDSIKGGNSQVAGGTSNFTPGPSKEDEKKADQERDRALAEFARLGAEYKKLEIQRLNDQLSANQKEVKQEADKYDALIAKEKEFLLMKGATPDQKKTTNSNIDKIEADKVKAVTDLKIRQEKEMVQQIAELRTKMSDLHETELQKQKDQINKFYDDQEKKNAGNESVIAKLRIERLTELSNAELREKERLEQEKAAIEAKHDTLSGSKPQNRIAKINKQYDDEIIALRAKFSKELQATKAFQDALALIENNRKADIDLANKAAEKDKRDFILDSAQQTSDALFSIMANNRNAETEKTIKSLENQRAAELDNKKLTEAQKDEINNRYNEKIKQEKLKAWRADKAAAISQAIINGILAVTKLLATPWAAAAAGIAAAANVAVILAQPEPQYAAGGMTNEDPAGYVSNATLFRNSASGRSFVAGEAGKEWIAPNWMLTNPKTAAIINSLEVVRKEKRMYAAGGFNSDTSNSTFSPGQMGYDFYRLESLMVGMIEAQNRANNKKVYQVWSEFKQFQDDTENYILAQTA